MKRYHPLRTALVLLLVFSNDIKSDINDYIYPSKSPSFGNFGGLGVIQNPSARFHDEGTLAFNWIQNGVYRRGSIVMYPFNWFEFSCYYK